MSGGFCGTAVVGVGRAGIEVLSTLAAGKGLELERSSDVQFKYVAVATDPALLERAPEGATEVELTVDPAALEDASVTHPYLTPVSDITGEGTWAQRPVGRYALDNQERDPEVALCDTIGRALNTLLPEAEDDRPRSCNIVHVHAMDDGTGSGTFPLVAHAIDEVTSDRHEQSGVTVYTAGIGIAPALSHGFGSGFEAVVPPTERRRYANTYAALRDLEVLTEASLDDPLPVFCHAEREHGGDQEFILGASEPQGRIDGPPYRHHFLVDGRGWAGDAAGRLRTRPRHVETVVAAVNGFTALGAETNTWLPPPTGTVHFGAFGQTQLSLPIEDIRTYCRLIDRIDELNEKIDTAGGGGKGTGELPEMLEDIKTDLAAARTEREAMVEQLTTSQYGPRHGRLALDEGKIRRELDREVLEEELTSLSAFHEAEYLARDLQTVMASRLPLAYAWQSRLLTWSEESAAGTVGRHYEGQREVWMLHSEANTALPEVERTGAGQHTFRRSGSDIPFPPGEDPYTVQFLTYCVEAPLSDLRLYAELDDAAGDRLDALLEPWDDHRVAFAYPEWHDRDIRQYFGIQTRVELPKLPELDLESVRIERTGEELVAWLSSHGLASYLWLADEWDRYQGYITTHGTKPVGWRTELADHRLTYHDIRAIVPNGDPVCQWFTGELSWDDLLSQVATELAEQEGISVAFTDGESA